MRDERVSLTTRRIPNLTNSLNYVIDPDYKEPLWKKTPLSFPTAGYDGRGSRGDDYKFAYVSIAERKVDKEFMPTLAQLLKHPLAVVAFVPKDVAILFAGAIAGAAAKTVTSPLDRVKFLMQTHGVRVGQESAKKALGFIEAITVIGKEEGIKGYWKGNLPQVALGMLRDEGFGSFYIGLGPSLIAIAPYVAVNFFVFDLLKKSLPEKYQKRTEISLVTAVLSTSLAILTTYPLDTVRRQMQIKGTPYRTVVDALSGIIERDGAIGLYRGFVPNALKSLPTSSIRLTTYDIVQRLITASEREFRTITEENRKKQTNTKTQ